MRPELVIFDMDGLIFDSERAFMQVTREVIAGYGYDLTEEVYVRTLGLSGADTRKIMLEVFGEDVPYEEIAAEARRRMNAKADRESLPVKPGIPGLLCMLQESGIPACVASSSPRATVETYLSSAGLDRWFGFIITGDDIEHAKPDPDIFLRCCRHFGVSPGNALVLEDSENGILAAANGGIPVICIPDMKQPDPAYAAKTTAILPDAGQAAEWILSHGRQ